MKSTLLNSKKYQLTEDPMSLPESPDYIKVMNKHELVGVVSMDDNQEQEAIIFMCKVFQSRETINVDPSTLSLYTLIQISG